MSHPDQRTSSHEPTKLDPFIYGLIEQKSFENLDPGETTYIPPWCIVVGAERYIHILPTEIMRNQPGEAEKDVKMKLIRDFDGFVLDLTALMREELEKYLVPEYEEPVDEEPVDEEDLIGIANVLYPELPDDLRGIHPEDTMAYNEEQRRVRVDFAHYYRKRYKRDYVYAVDELANK